MPQTEGAGIPLTELLAQLVTAATASPGRPAGKKLPGGLFVAALHRQGRLALTAWRTVSRLPSRKECEIVARDAGFSAPVYKLYERPDGVTAFVITDTAAKADRQVPARPKPTPPTARQRVSTPVDTEAAQKARDEAERQRHIRWLVFCAQVQGLRSAWFRRHEALEARCGYLRDLSLDELREECQSRYGRLQLIIAVKLALLLARWRHLCRALPVRATAKRTRKPRLAVAA